MCCSDGCTLLGVTHVSNTAKSSNALGWPKAAKGLTPMTCNKMVSSGLECSEATGISKDLARVGPHVESKWYRRPGYEKLLGSLLAWGR